LGNLEGSINSGGFDFFLIKIKSSNEIVFIKEFGTSSNDYAEAVTIDSNNLIYVAGTTQGRLDPGSSVGGQDDFLMKFLTQTGTKYGQNNSAQSQLTRFNQQKSIPKITFTYQAIRLEARKITTISAGTMDF
jgi:hypothetical protein